jgi:hypothetical protein
MDYERLGRAAADYYKPLMTGATGGFIVSIRDFSFSKFMTGSILIVLFGFLCYYEIVRVEEKYLET